MHIGADSILIDQSRILAGDLDIDPAAVLRISDVSCGGARLPTPGSRCSATAR